MEYVRSAIAWQSALALRWLGRDPLGELLQSFTYEVAKHTIVPIVALVPALLVAVLVLWKCSAVTASVGGALLGALWWLAKKLWSIARTLLLVLAALAAFLLVYFAGVYLLLPYGDALATYWIGHGPAAAQPVDKVPGALMARLDAVWQALCSMFQ